MYYYFRLRGNVPPFTSDGTEALEEHFNAEKYAAHIMEQNNYNSFEIVTA